MRSDRGLVVERAGRKVTALDASGDLITFRTKREDIMVGMEVSIPAPAPLFTWRRLAPATALALVIVLVSSFGYQQYLYAQPTVAYVTVDSLGSIELEVNRAGLVKSATAIDDAGQEAISTVEYRNKPVQDVVAALVRAQDPEKKSDVLLAVVPVTPVTELSEKEARKAEKAVEKFEKKVADTAGASSTNVTSLRLDVDVREAAQRLGISAGRAALWALSLQNETTQVEPEPGIEPEPEPEPEPDPEPGESPGQGTTPPGQQGHHAQGDPPGQQEPPGQEKKDSLLDAIKSALPEVDTDTLTDLNEHKDSKEREKFLKDLTKSFIDRVVEEIGEDDDDPEDSKPDGGKGNGKGNGQAGNPGNAGDGGKGVSGEDKDKGKGKSGSDKGSTEDDVAGDGGSGGEKVTTPGVGTVSPVTPSETGPSVMDGDGPPTTGGPSKREGLSRLLESFLRQIPWRHRK